MTTTEKAAIVGTQYKNADWEEKPGLIMITDDGNSGRVYFEREHISMAVDLGDLMDAIKAHVCGGEK